VTTENFVNSADSVLYFDRLRSEQQIRNLFGLRQLNGIVFIGSSSFVIADNTRIDKPSLEVAQTTLVQSHSLEVVAQSPTIAFVLI